MLNSVNLEDLFTSAIRQPQILSIGYFGYIMWLYLIIVWSLPQEILLCLLSIIIVLFTLYSETKFRTRLEFGQPQLFSAFREMC